MVLFDALGTGLLMNQYLDPEADQSDLFAKAIGKLLAVTPAAATAASGED